MYNALAAGGFFVLKGAFGEPHVGVITKFAALCTEFAVLGVVVTFAVNINHVVDGFVFSYHAFMGWVWRLRLHARSHLGRNGVLQHKL